MSILAAANHHDSHFLPFLVNLAQAIGINLKLVTADEAYHDKDGSLYSSTGVIVTTPPSAKTTLPPNVNAESGAVFCNDVCEIPMLRVGFEDQVHEYKCNAEPGQCQHCQDCSQNRFILVDARFFSKYHMKPYKLNKLMRFGKTLNGPLIC